MTEVEMEHVDGLEISTRGHAWRAVPAQGLLIGRASDCDLVVIHPDVSRHHARVVRDPAGWLIQDLGSTNGIWNNGRRAMTHTVAGQMTVHLGHVPDAPAIEFRPVHVLNPHRSPDETAQPMSRRIRGSLGFSSGRRQLGHGVEWLIRVGREADNDLVIDDPLVSRHHASVACLGADGRRFLEISDLGSANGTFVDGGWIKQSTGIEPGQDIRVGSNRLMITYAGVRLLPPDDVVLHANRVSVVTADGVTRLHEIDLVVRRGELVAVVGPSGAGKSTLLGVLTGTRPIAQGRVSIAGRSLHEDYDELSQQMGYVPQDDIVHAPLTARQELSYAAQLRTAPDVTRLERRKLVSEILAQLGLTEAADRPISHLSGGQRKRTNVALELLTRPPLMFLDEPTSGLDPGHDKALMSHLRQLADDGRAVVVVTHNITYLDVCDRVLVLAPGGIAAYFGSPRGALRAFGAADFAELFQRLESEAVPSRAVLDDAPEREQFVALPPIAASSRRWWYRTSVLTRRYVAVIAADRRNLALLLLQAPVLGLLIRAIGSRHGLAVVSSAQHPTARGVLFTLVLSATWLGASNSIREIVKERAIFQRERLIGVPISSYLASKVVPLSLLMLVQVVVLQVVALAGRAEPAQGVLISPGWLELTLDLWLTGLTALCLGLLISAIVLKPDKAMTLLPLLLIPQFVLCGGVLNLSETPVLKPLSYVVSARWGFAAAASTARLKNIEVAAADAAATQGGQNPSVDPDVRTAQRNDDDPLWRHQPRAWIVDSGVLLAMTGLALLLTWLQLARTDARVRVRARRR